MEHRPASAAASEETCTSIFVGGLNEAVTADDLETLFCPFGNISGIQAKKGFAFVEFESPDSMRAACSMDGRRFLGKNLGVRPNLKDFKKAPGDKRPTAHQAPIIRSADVIHAPTQPIASTTTTSYHKPMATSSAPAATQVNSIFIGGLPENVTAAEIESLCSNYGTVVQVTKKDANRYAFVDFDSPTSAQSAAFSLDGTAPFDNMEGVLGVRINTPENKDRRKRTGMQAGLDQQPGKRPAGGGPATRDCCSVFLGSLQLHDTADDVNAIVAPAIQGVGMITKIDKRDGKAYAFVDFDNRMAALAATSLDGQERGGKTLACRLNLPEFKQKKPIAAAAPPAYPYYY